ncbi:estradiol 17-beta-dehydrogenase 11-like [Drosophila nasuta]|uniref:estradiol 17-beta-dehydrogenase 11-like n=1 Tax=Drosophila nasuta TaxID=42062 RepID=UPI00295EB9D4|nr:estradiol 17-beta-dehydrogenase 11-like [Drosophila nasuta]
MEIQNQLIKLLATLLVIGFALSTPVLLLAVMLSKIGECFKYKSPKSIIGEVAVVTGAAHGLGRAIALELAELGCHIAVVDIDIKGAEETVEKIHQISRVKAKAYKVNVTSFTQITDLNAKVTRDLGSVTILINNAGVILLRNPLDPAPEEVQRMIDVNLTSHFWTKTVFLPTIKRLRKGNIVTISSASSLLPFAYHTTYTATKFGATGHMKALQLELAVEKQHDIHVTTVMPMFLDTNDEVSELAYISKVNRLYPLIRGETVARRIVKGMLAGEREIKIPFIVDILHRILNLLPLSWQERLVLLFASNMFLSYKEISLNAKIPKQ